jgi:hypothetical protein
MYKYNKTKKTYNFKIKSCGRYLGLSMNLRGAPNFFLLFDIFGGEKWQTEKLYKPAP